MAFNEAVVRAVLLNMLIAPVLLTIATIVTQQPVDAGEGSPPRVIDNSKIQSRLTLREGTNVKGEGTLLIQWKKDGEPIGPAWSRFRISTDEKVLRIKNVEKEDTGTYTCLAVNGFGRTTVEYNMVVFDRDLPEPLDDDLDSEVGMPLGVKDVAPFWVNKQEIREMTQAPLLKPIASELKMACHGAGLPTPDLHWFKDGVLLTQHQIEMTGWTRPNRFTLQLSDLREEDSGRYMCKATNTHGSLNATFNIRVSNGDSAAPIFDQQHPVNSTVREGLSATFQCKVRSAIPPLIRTRLEDNSTLFTADGMDLIVLDKLHTDTMVGANSTYLNRLVIPQVTLNNAGWYICVVTNPSGHMVFRKAHLNVVPMVHLLPETPPSLAVIIGVPVALFLLVLTFYAIYFLQRNKSAPTKMSPATNGRPPPPQFPQPPLPIFQQENKPSFHKSTPSPHTPYSNGYYRAEQRYTPSGTGGTYMTALLGSTYHQYDPQAAVPLKYGDERLYEATPQPYEMQWGVPRTNEFDYDHGYPEGRLQPYPSMYSCR